MTDLRSKEIMTARVNRLTRQNPHTDMTTKKSRTLSYSTYSYQTRTSPSTSFYNSFSAVSTSLNSKSSVPHHPGNNRKNISTISHHPTNSSIINIKTASPLYSTDPKPTTFIPLNQKLPLQGNPNNLDLLAGPLENNFNSSATFQQYESPQYVNEPPLLDELGVNIEHVRTKSISVILPVQYAKSHIDSSIIMEDTDMAGPIVYAILLGGELLLAGKVHFGYIYGFGSFGCISLSLVLNLMSPKAVSVWTIVSVLGYALLPVNILALINVVYRVKYMGVVGIILAALTVVWCTVSSTRLFEKGCEMRDQRYLLAYPNALLYSAFVIITIF